jgi:hypothetical protein
MQRMLYFCLYSALRDGSLNQGVQCVILPWLSDISRHRRYQHLISRAENMRLLSRALAFAVLVAGAILPNASHAQVVPAIKGGGSQINVYGLYTLVKDRLQFHARLSSPSSSPSNTFDANGWNQGFAGGADFRLGRFVFGQPALGTRFTWSTGTFGKQRTFVFGPELTTFIAVSPLRRLSDRPREHYLQERARQTTALFMSSAAAWTTTRITS